MNLRNDERILKVLRSNATDVTTEIDPTVLSTCIDDAEVILIGEATHGTHEFYATRCAITKRLITDFGFGAVAIEGDWPDAYRVNRFVRGEGEDREGGEALGGFRRFPAWMWRNVDVLDFVGWLRDHNDSLDDRRSYVGFYGLDLYSLYPSAAAVISYLDRVSPDLAAQARSRYSCFEDLSGDGQEYAYNVLYGLQESCEEDVLNQLIDMMNSRHETLDTDGMIAEEEQFAAERNAWAVYNAERYYRTMLNADVQSWNLRDQHMMETLMGLRDHLGRYGERPGIVVWAHNSHLGDARQTEMARRGEWNLGQLTREKLDGKVRSIGMTTYAGTVTAADDWDQPAHRCDLRPGRHDSYEGLFHQVGLPAFMLQMQGEVAGALDEERLERAVGVIYRPETERYSHYFNASIARQFDGVIHIDHTRALEPIETRSGADAIEPPETYPSSL